MTKKTVSFSAKPRIDDRVEILVMTLRLPLGEFDQVEKKIFGGAFYFLERGIIKSFDRSANRAAFIRETWRLGQMSP